MIKREELANPNSCINRAKDDELVFVLLERDHAAPYAIRCWAEQRVALGKNEWGDAQIQEALECATAIEDKAGPVRATDYSRSQARRKLGA